MQTSRSTVNRWETRIDPGIWPNREEREYLVRITLSEFTCLCPHGGFPYFATIHLEYVPDRYHVVELKAQKLSVDAFRARHVSREESVNGIYGVLGGCPAQGIVAG